MTQHLAFETPRLVLRELVDDDAPAVHAYASDVEVVRYLDWGPSSVEETAQFLATARWSRETIPRTVYLLAIVLRVHGRLVGGCRIEIRSPAHESGDIGYVLDRRAWGQGYATEASRALLEFGVRGLALSERVPRAEERSYRVRA